MSLGQYVRKSIINSLNAVHSSYNLLIILLFEYLNHCVLLTYASINCFEVDFIYRTSFEEKNG